MRLLVLAVAVLLVAPAAVAQPKQEMAVTGLTVDGELDLRSDSFFAEVVGVGEEPRRMVLQAESMRIVMENYSAEHYPPLAKNSENAAARTIYEGSGRLFTDAVRDKHKVTLVTHDASVALRSSQAELAPKAKDQVTRSGGYTKERAEEVFQMGPQFRLRDLHGSVRVEGNFSFNLYEWDATIEHAQGRETFWTGERFTPLEPLQRVPDDLGLPTHYGGRVDWQIAYVYVENGTLDLEFRKEDGGSASYFMGTARGFASGDFELTPSNGGGSEGSVIHFAGGYDSLFDAPRTNRLYATLDTPSLAGGPSPAGGTRTDAGGEPARPGTDLLTAPATTPAPTLPGSDLPAWTYLLALPALLLLMGGVAYVRPIRRMHKLEDAYDLGIHGYVVDNAPPLLRSRRFGVQASLMYTVALLEERGPDEAEAHLVGVRPRSRPTGATHEYLLARIRAAQTRFDEARQHVRACLDAEPAFVMEIRRNASLEFLMRPPSDPGEGYA